MKRQIAVLTSGGDAPGMNACIRGVVRRADKMGCRVWGIGRGYAGLLDGEAQPLSTRSVSGVIQRGGTILGTARSDEFLRPERRQEAVRSLQEREIEGLVIIGGDGSLRGALELERLGMPVVGIPASIDNDLPGTDISLGVDTALNTALEAIDKIKDTASAHRRAFIVEVMGRNCGYLALASAMAGGAEIVLVPEVEIDVDSIIREYHRAHRVGKPHFIVVAAEGARLRALDLCEHLSLSRPGEEAFEVRLTVLGHVQRGGSPTAFDRILGSRLGAAAVELLDEDQHGVMAGLLGDTVAAVSLDELLAAPRPFPRELYDLAQSLA